eukprot:COSAG05_NODE_5193_length_1240_cov_72.967572_1_plen_101_part_00
MSSQGSLVSTKSSARMEKRPSARAGMFFVSSLTAFDMDVVAPAERVGAFGAEASKLGPVASSSFKDRGRFFRRRLGLVAADRSSSKAPDADATTLGSEAT